MYLIVIFDQLYPKSPGESTHVRIVLGSPMGGSRRDPISHALHAIVHWYLASLHHSRQPRVFSRCFLVGESDFAPFAKGSARNRRHPIMLHRPKRVLACHDSDREFRYPREWHPERRSTGGIPRLLLRFKTVVWFESTDTDLESQRDQGSC